MRAPVFVERTRAILQPKVLPDFWLLFSWIQSPFVLFFQRGFLPGTAMPEQKKRAAAFAVSPSFP
jgi:hypothetical protein